MYSDFLERLQANKKIDEQGISRVNKIKFLSLFDTLPSKLIKSGICSDIDVAKALADTTNYPLINEEVLIKAQTPPYQELSDYFKNNNILVFDLDTTDESLDLVLLDPLNEFLIDSIRWKFASNLNIHIASASSIETSWQFHYGDGKSKIDQIIDVMDEDNEHDNYEHLKDLASEAPIIKLVNYIFQKALESSASDIHIEPFENSLKIRLRIDGMLQDISAPPIISVAAVLSRIKIMAKLNIAERRLPQDGRIKIQLLGKELDLRVSIIPTLYGESAVIRLLDKESINFDFDKLGFNVDNGIRFRKKLEQPHGIVLITGPTGSGKSTTLYTALSFLNKEERKIITVEDPIEYHLDGVNQIQVKTQIGLTFSRALRSIVRQDPDIIMIGEMRDAETAAIAVQSALTGHLVLSTLHTNNAASSVTRLLDMGIEDYLLSSTLNGILAQRLVRKLCPHCKEAYALDTKIAEEVSAYLETPSKALTVYKAHGCPECDSVGYKGRVAIFEYLEITDTIKHLINKSANDNDLYRAALNEGMIPIRIDGLLKAIDGVTSVEEVIRVTID